MSTTDNRPLPPAPLDRATSAAPREAGDRTPPHNLDAEEALLGAAMLETEALEVAATEVESEDFYKPSHRHIHGVLRDLWEAGIVRPDPVLVSDELAAKGLLEGCGGPGALMGIQAMCPSTTNAAQYARIIVEASTMRRLLRAAIEIRDLAYSADNVPDAVDMARHMVATVELPIGTGSPSPDVADFLAGEDKFDWLVEGLLERRDRIIITGAEGGGKSTLLRQLAVMFAAGMHPFRFQPTRPIRVLIVDVENSKPQIRRALEPMIKQVARRETWNPDNLRIECRTEGIDLTQRHDSRWLLERVASNRPDVLLTGPLYKLHAEDPNEEMPARKIARVMDMVRAKYDCAIVLEAHAPHGPQASRSLRPYGSSLWLRWPEFGYGLRPDTESGLIDGRAAAVWFEAWRGSRDVREWPARLSSDGKDFWPWRDSGYLAPQPVQQEAGW